MSPTFSPYLDVLRLLSALIVFAHHASYPRFDGGWIAWLGGYGHEAVVVFFVLSGLVVTYAASAKDRTLKAYAASRLSRLWSVALPSIALTLLMDAAGRLIAPAAYDMGTPTAGGVLAGGAFLNEIWFAQIAVGSNVPYWSLSYEFVYYVLYGVFFFGRSRWLLLLAAIAVGPKMLLLLPAWVMGSLAWRAMQMEWSRRAAIAMAVLGAALALTLALGRVGSLYVTWRWETVLGPRMFELLGHSQSFITDNLTALALAVHLVGAAALMRGIKLPDHVTKLVQRCAQATFAIYLMHYPALYFFKAVSLRMFGETRGLMVGIASLSVGILLTAPTDKFRSLLRRTMLYGHWRRRVAVSTVPYAERD